MYGELLARRANSKPKHKPMFQPDMLAARSAVHRRRIRTPASNFRGRTLSSWPNPFLHHWQTVEQRSPPESFGAHSSSTPASSRSYRLTEYEVSLGIDLAHSESSPTGIEDNARPLPGNLQRYAESGRQLDRSGILSFPPTMSSHPGIPEVGYYRLGRSERTAGNAPSLNPLLAIDSGSRPLRDVPTSPYAPSITSRGLPANVEPHALSREYFIPDYASRHQLDDVDETSSRQPMNHQRNTEYRGGASDQLQSQSYRRLRRSSVDSQPSHGLAREELDGLGDRRRSWTPEDDSWAILRTNITPDERLPSLHSSFTSTSNSASDSSDTTFVTLPTADTSGVCTVLYDDTESEEFGMES